MTVDAFPLILRNPPKLLQLLKTKPETYWIQRGEKRALALFHAMASRVPAYKDFLKKHHINPSTIKTIHDFSCLPTIDKNNYLRAYPLEALCWGGKLKEQSWTISATSGSTGEPFYFPRTHEQDLQYATTAELYLLDNFHIDTKKTLYIIGFPMGVWIGGVFTYEALSILQERGYPLSIITPGINKLEIIKAVKNLGPFFDQIIIGSYAPFLKDILDDAPHYGVNWKAHHVGFIFSAEGFSETFRDYIIRKTGLPNPYTTTLNHYGTVDMGTMAHETPLCIFLRRKAISDTKLYSFLFGSTNRLPTLTQYLPEMFYFESQNGNLLCSTYSGLPLIRYDLKDHGNIITQSALNKTMRDYDVDIDVEIRTSGIKKNIWNLPFVYVFERSDFSVSFFAFQIYPETIRKAIQQKQFDDMLTGKFTMMVMYDKHGNQQFHVHIELRPDKNETVKLRSLITNAMIEQLTTENSEYRKTREEYPQQTIPILTFWPYEHATYFQPGGKQKWVKK